MTHKPALARFPTPTRAVGVSTIIRVFARPAYLRSF